jgi:glycosyltransferase involved in cell wall biosynthesis
VSRKKILVLIDWYLPGYKAGGPIQSVANIIQHLQDDFEFAVITSDRDLHESAAYPSVKSNEWTTAPDGTRCYYFSSDQYSSTKMKSLLLSERADYIYINSLFSYRFAILPLFIRKRILPSRKVVLAPRGMLGEGALNIKPAKKKLFLLASKVYGLFRNITWHASTRLEAEEIKKAFGKSAKVITAVNLSAHRQLHYAEKQKPENGCQLVFISRIAAKKNLVPVIAQLKKLPAELKVNFDIYGPVDEEAYWNECLEVMKVSPANIRIHYKGPIENNKVQQMLSGYHFSVLYTRHENFGHSIIESMAAGCPVIISDQTPWRNLEEKKCGWDIPVDNEELLGEVLIKACKMSSPVYNEWRRSALTFASGIIHDENANEANKSLFL